MNRDAVHPDGSAFSVRLEPNGDALVVNASGELDIAAAGTFETELGEALQRKNGSAVILDLGNVTFIDSTGLRALLGAAETSRRDGARLRIRRDISPPVKRLLELTGCRERLPFTD